MKYILFIILFFLTACNDRGIPSNILPFDKMKLVFWDQLKADAYTKENLALDSLKNKNLSFENFKLQQQIFNKYQISKEQFYLSYNYYLTNDELMTELLDTIIAIQTNVNLDEMNSRYINATSNNTYKLFLKDLFIPKTIYNINPNFTTLE